MFWVIIIALYNIFFCREKSLEPYFFFLWICIQFFVKFSECQLILVFGFEYKCLAITSIGRIEFIIGNHQHQSTWSLSSKLGKAHLIGPLRNGQKVVFNFVEGIIQRINNEFILISRRIIAFIFGQSRINCRPDILFGILSLNQPDWLPDANQHAHQIQPQRTRLRWWVGRSPTYPLLDCWPGIMRLWCGLVAYYARFLCRSRRSRRFCGTVRIAGRGGWGKEREGAWLILAGSATTQRAST